MQSLLADGHEMTSVSNSLKFSSNSQNRSIETVNLSQTNNYLVVCGSQLLWNGNVDELKQFTTNVLNMSGKWKSPGGDVKMFTSLNEEFIFKWNGIKSRKIIIIKDTEHMVFETMRSLSYEENTSNSEAHNEEPDDHVFEAVSLDLPSQIRSDSDKHFPPPAQVVPYFLKCSTRM